MRVISFVTNHPMKLLEAFGFEESHNNDGYEWIHPHGMWADVKPLSVEILCDEKAYNDMHKRLAPGGDLEDLAIGWAYVNGLSFNDNAHVTALHDVYLNANSPEALLTALGFVKKRPNYWGWEHPDKMYATAYQGGFDLRCTIHQYNCIRDRLIPGGDLEDLVPQFNGAFHNLSYWQNVERVNSEDAIAASYAGNCFQYGVEIEK